MQNKLLAISIIILAVCLSNVLWAQSPTYFNRVYDIDSMVDFGSGVIVEDSTYVVAGEGNKEIKGDIKEVVRLMRLNEHGNVLSTRNFLLSRPNYNEFFRTSLGFKEALIKNSAGNYVIMGTGAYVDTQDNDGYPLQMRAMVAQFTPDFDTIWTRIYGKGQSKMWFNTGVQTRDGGYAFTGVYVDSQKSEQIWLMKIDSQGNKDWGRFYGDYSQERADGIIQTQDRGYVIVGNKNRNNHYKGLIIKVDSSGQKEWHKLIGKDIGEFGSSLSDVIKVKGNELMVCGASEGTRKSSIARAIKMNLKGQVLWDRKYGSSPKRASFTDMVYQEKDSSILIAGTEDMDTVDIRYPQSMGWLMKIDAQTGDSLWQRTFYHSQYDGDFPRDIKSTEDRGYIIAGSTRAGTQDIWIVKVDSIGCDTPNCTPATGIGPGSIEKNAPQISLYPNPAQQYVTLRYHFKGLKGPFRLEVVDVTGKSMEIRQLSTYKGSLNISTRDFLPGVYFLRLFAKREPVTVRKLLVR